LAKPKRASLVMELVGVQFHAKEPRGRAEL
jgi:hypothetical protein